MPHLSNTGSFMNPSPMLTHEYAFMIYNKINEDKYEPTFWGEVLSKKEQIIAVYKELKDSYQNNDYMYKMVERMEKVVMEEITIMEAKHEGFIKQGDSHKLHSSNLSDLLKHES